MEELQKLASILNEQLDLTPYEARAYLSLIVHGPMSPSDLAQKADIPRPRTYDVLSSLIDKGLLVEQSGKPLMYASVEPVQGLRSLLMDIEIKTSRQLEEKKKTVQTLTRLLTQRYEKSRELKVEKSRVWFTRRDNAFIATYSEAIKNCKKEILVASTSLHPPEREIREAVNFAVRGGKTVKVVRQVTNRWTLEDLEDYRRYIEAGAQVKYLDVKEIPLRFMVFDEQDVIIVLPSESELSNVEALWLRIPALAMILVSKFEELWDKGRPMMPILKDVEKKKTKKEAERT